MCHTGGGFSVSGQVIHDVVIPIVSRIMIDGGYASPHGMLDIRDAKLEEYLEEQLRRRFGVIGANGCQHLKEQLDEAKKNDPYEFQQLLKQLLEKYVKLEVQMRRAEEEKKLDNGPPDRFLEQRKKYPVLEYRV
jgi:hypothetical protein